MNWKIQQWVSAEERISKLKRSHLELFGQRNKMKKIMKNSEENLRDICDITK